MRAAVIHLLCLLSLLAAILPPAQPAAAVYAPGPSWQVVEEPAPRLGVAEAFRSLPYARRAGVGWDRLVFSWQYIQPDGPGDWNAATYFPDPLLADGRQVGMSFVGILQDTPRWAASEPEVGARSPPLGLDLPVDDPRNHWATFVRRMAREYRGRVDAWIIWNEPEFRASDQGGIYVTWEGSDEEYARLLKVAALAIKQGNPDARVLFGATSFWIEAVNRRTPFLERIVRLLGRDPDARAAGFFFDAVPLNIYWSPDDLVGVGKITRTILARHGLDKPIWIVETNAMPYDDPKAPKRPNGQRVTQDVQASFTVQALAIGLAAGYERIGWHAMIDQTTEDEVWGLVRNDGTPRAALWAYQTAALYLGNADWVRPAHLPRPRHRPGIPPGDPDWQIYQVVAQRGQQRVRVLWNPDPLPRSVRLPREAASAFLVDKTGATRWADEDGDSWLITLPPARAHRPQDAPDVYFIGGDPLLLVEEGVAADRPLSPPRLVR